MFSLVLCVLIGANSIAPEITTGRKVIILGAEVEVVRLDYDGIPVAFATEYGIGVNEEFLTYPFWIQEVLIAHEIGHMELNNFVKPGDVDRDWFPLLWGTAPPNEVEADLYAVNLLGAGKMWETLIFAYQKCVAVNHSCAIEALNRIDMIEGMYCR